MKQQQFIPFLSQLKNKIVQTKTNFAASKKILQMKTIALLLFLSPASFCLANGGTLSGKVTSNGQPLPYAQCYLEELHTGAVADENGFFSIGNLPKGTYRIRVSSVGYLPDVQEITLERKDSLHLEIELRESPFDLNTIVVSGTRTDRRRHDNPVAVNVLTEKTFQITQSNTLSEGLCFQPGLRVETDCQTCNYTQLRMNGLGGSYSQILVDGRPVFTSLMSLYSMEQIPASQIERVEIVKGGGSVLYGSSAIAGTVNVITQMPREDEWSVSANSSLVNGEATDHFLNANASIVNEEATAGVSLFASNRRRQEWDANGDGFSELPKLRNSSFGFKTYFQPSPAHRLELNGWSINEFRRGGNAFDLPADQADQSEERRQEVLIGGLDYTFSPTAKNYQLNAYFAAQNTDRVHYTGIDHTNGWGNTDSRTLTGGLQYDQTLRYWQGKNVLTLGLEHQFDDTFDEIEAYGYLIDQETHLTGLFVQSDWEISPQLTLLSGLRANRHNLVDRPVLTPRLSALFRPADGLQMRASYARGFRAPQAFEADLHIAFAGGGVALISIDPNLAEETSNSYTLSLDLNKAQPAYAYGFTVDAFHTRLFDAFVLEEIGVDDEGNIRLLRKNGGNSTVQGLTLEGRFNYDQKVQVEAGFTVQTAEFDSPVEWSAEISGSNKYLRTPERYGSFTLTILPEAKLNGSLSGVYTGPMAVPHFAGAPGVEQDLLFRSPDFLELNSRLNYRLHLHSMEVDMDIFAGVQNLFSAYQSDFDMGKDRDSNYVYGPARPRTFFVGVKFGG